MHPLTRLFNYLKHKDFSMAVAREHIGTRDLTNWYPEWLYECMETDEIRNQPYEDAVRAKVAGKIVLELGTGRKALWAVRCARAGAKRVYAIEANRKAYESSLAFLQSQGIDNVQLIHGFSDKVELPERCEVLIHDLVGDIGSSEGMIPFIEDARQRFLTPDAIHIPERCTTYAVLGEDPKLSWAEWAFSYLLRELRPYEALSFVRFFGFPLKAALSEPQVFEEIVFSETPQLRTDKRLVMEVQRDGKLRGVLLFICLDFGEAGVVNTWTSQTSWPTPYVRFRSPESVRRGDLVEMSVRTDLAGDPRYAIEVTHRAEGSARVIGEYAWVGD